MTTISRLPRSAWWCLNDSLTIRFIRFLAVAFRQCFLEIASPSLAPTQPLSLQSTVNHLSRLRFAFWNTRPKAAAVSNRSCLLNRRRAVGDSLRDVSCSNPVLLSPCCRPRGGLRRQLGAALGAAALENKTARLGRHTGAETMRACALQFARLIRTFHVPATCVSGRRKRPTPERAGKGTLAPRQCQ